MSGFGDNYQWYCAGCKQWHKGLVLDIAFSKPETYFAIPEADRERRVFWNPDMCVIDNAQFFVRGVLHLPIIGADGATFRLGVWSTLSKKDFDVAMEHWDDPKQSQLGAMSGSLSSEIGFGYPATAGLKTTVQLVSEKTRPRIELQPVEHPLAIDQREGITVERVIRMAAEMMHRGGN